MNEQDERMKLLTALQPKFREAMGEWQVGDSIYDMRWGVGTITSVDYKKLLVHFPSITGYISLFYSDLTHADRLPFPIDPRNPERGLWGMVDWSDATVTFSFCPDGLVDLIIDPDPDCQEIVFHLSPELALLKALAHQEGVEVK